MLLVSETNPNSDNAQRKSFVVGHLKEIQGIISLNNYEHTEESGRESDFR